MTPKVKAVKKTKDTLYASAEKSMELRKNQGCQFSEAIVKFMCS